MFRKLPENARKYNYFHLPKRDEWINQLDNLPIHVSNSTMQWFRQNQVTVTDGPALSPDLNSMKNLWGRLTRDVYANGRQFATVQDLKLQIERNWFSLKPEFFQILVLSMLDRVFHVVRKNG